MASKDAGGLPVIKNDVILEVHLWKWLKATKNNGAGVSTRRGFPVIEPPVESGYPLRCASNQAIVLPQASRADSGR